MSLTYCTSCGKELPEGGEFCPNCGTSIGPVVGSDETAVERIGRDTLGSWSLFGSKYDTGQNQCFSENILRLEDC